MANISIQAKWDWMYLYWAHHELKITGCTFHRMDETGELSAVIHTEHPHVKILVVKDDRTGLWSMRSAQDENEVRGPASGSFDMTMLNKFFPELKVPATTKDIE